MSKIYNIYALMSLLSDGKKKKLNELSQELEISPTMVRKYFDELEKLGIYVESIKGRYGGYYLSNSYYKIPLLPFTENDISVLENLKNDTNSRNVNILLSKIKKYMLINLETNDKFFSENIREMYNEFNKAILLNKKIYIEYYTIDEVKIGTKNYTNRTVIPDEIFYFQNKWYLHGFCELRKDIRQFEFERIKKYKIL